MTRLVQLLDGPRHPIALTLGLQSGMRPGPVVSEDVRLAIDPECGGRRATGSFAVDVVGAGIGHHARARVVAGRTGPVGDMKTAVEARDGVHVDNEELDGEIKAVETGLGVVPGRAGDGPRRGEVDGEAEGGAQREDKRGDEQQKDLGPVAALAELLGPLGSGGEDGEGGDGDGEEGQEGAGG